LVERHESLRTVFPTVNGTPVIQLSEVNYQLSVINLQNLPPSEIDIEVQRLINEDAQRPFDLENGPLFRATLLHTAHESHILLVNMHHIISDGWSLNVLIREFTTLYEAFLQNKSSPLPPLPIQYVDFAHWQRQWLKGEVLEKQLNYWKQQLAGTPALLELPTDHPRPPVQSFQGSSLPISLSPELTTQLKQISQQTGTTLFMMLWSAFATLLSRYSGQSDIVIGSPIANRTQSVTESLIGFFVNTLVLRLDMTDNPSFEEVLLKARRVALEAYSHQDIPFEQLVEVLQPERNLSHSPLFQVMFVLQNAPLADLELAGLSLSVLELENVIAKFDLTLSLAFTPSGISGTLEYNTDLFERATIERLSGHLQTLLTGIVENPQTLIGDLPLLTAAEQQQLKEWNDTATDYPHDKTIIDLFEEQVSISPAAIAVVFEDQHLTYRELNSQANQLAHYLQTLGVKPEVLVGICLERSLEMVIGLLGILKAGGAYVPLDPAYPAARLAFMLEDAQVPVLLTQSSNQEKLPESQASVVCLDVEALSQYAKENVVSGVGSENLAYVIYTSGSTGKPKGVMIQHDSIADHCRVVQSYYQLNSSDKVLQFASLNFDASLEQIFSTLITGARLILRSEQLWTAIEFSQNIVKHEMTVVDLPPAYWQQWLQEYAHLPEFALNNPLKLVVVGGDVMSPEMLYLWQQTQMNSIRFINAYGPTEATITTTTFEITSQYDGKKHPQRIPIGHPLTNKTTYILDTHNNPVPIGVQGELHIGGTGLARGYKGHPDLTAEKFIKNPFNKELKSRLYKTGDLARYLPDGNIEYLGRIDNQVKIRGFRIELGEIEAVLGQHPAVRENAVIVHEASQTDKRLVAYLVPHQEQVIENTELRGFLSERLPDYMIPPTFVTLEALPLTPNGKIDRHALPAPEKVDSPREDTYIMPQTEVEVLIATAWQEVLHLEKVGIHDNFFDLGGHSLLLVQLQSKLQTVFTKEISVVKLFEHPTIHALAQHLGQTTPEPQSRSRNRDRTNSTDIAIIGMSGRFPGAADIEAFWQNLRNGVESITFFSDEELHASGIDTAILNQPNYVKASGVLSDIEKFDALFFDINPKEAEITDPQHRLFLECAWEAIENAGYEASTSEFSIGVYAGVGMNTYLLNNLSTNRELKNAVDAYQVMIGNGNDFLPTRVSYKLNLKGPSVNVQTACSTSLVAVSLACDSLLNGHCDMALAGGVSVRVPHKSGYLYQEGMILSPDGHCRAFDAKAQGTVGGNGVGIVVLKRLEDAIADGDSIQAIIKGSATNNDGALKVGYTAPSVEGQALVIGQAQARAGIEPETISYIETHGTGTELGDPIEIAALTKAFGQQLKNKCAIGSLKTNIGHTDAAAGVAGLIKTVLALKHQLLPPSLHFEQGNPQIDFANSPFYINAKLSEWKTDGSPRRAGVSSFGIGGTNAHLILEEAPAIQASGNSRPWQLLVLSAKTPSALESATANLTRYLEHYPELNLADVVYTLSKGRKAFNYRRILVCQEINEAKSALSSLDPTRVLSQFQENQQSIVFMFSGQGAQYVNMGLELYQTEPLFREEVDKCSEYLKPLLGLDLRQVLYPEHTPSPESEGNQDALNQTAITQPALFVIEYALAKLWMSWGVYPEAMIGHSIGEYVAACLAGVFSLEDVLSLVTARGQMMQSVPSGAMLAVPLPFDKIPLGKGLFLAAINAPGLCVVSGFTEAVDVLETQLSEQGVECRRLHTSHAFHSEMMEPILAAFTEQVAQINLGVPQIPYLSNVTGNWITAAEATEPSYWSKHLRQTVRFADGIQELLKKSARILLEVGLGRTLTTLAKRQQAAVVLSSLRHPSDKQSDVAFLLNTVGKLWLHGGQIDWSGFYANERRYRLPLPTYPFERQRYWIDPPKSANRHFSHVATSQSMWQSVIEASRKQAETSLLTLDNFLSDYSEKRQHIDDLCLAYMNLALKELGAFCHADDKYSVETFCQRFHIDPRYQQLVSHWLNVLVEKGELQQEGQNITHLRPLTTETVNTLLEKAQRQWASDPQWNNLQYVSENLVTVLRGEKEPRELFFTHNLDLPEKSVQEEYSLFLHYNAIMRACLKQVVKLLPTTVKLRILEIGAGTGMTTDVVLPVLPAQQTHYTFTDITQFFLNRAQQKFSTYPFVDYRWLNLNKSPQEQGYEPQSFDVVIATLSLHVTQKVGTTLQYVHSLLAPGGLFIIWEITQPQLDFAIVEGLVMEPLEDGERNQCHPFLSKEQWYEVLRKSGFVKMESFPKTDILGHHIFVAQAEFSVPAFTNLVEQTETVNTNPVSFQTHPRSKELSQTYVAPRNDIERKIANEWQEMLSIASVGIHDNFFELGGDSLLAVQLIANLRETFQTDFSAHSLLNAPTIAALAEFIGETHSKLLNQPSSLVEIQTGNSLKPPLFLIHPVGGHVYFYRDLAHHLGSEQPVYGIQVGW